MKRRILVILGILILVGMLFLTTDAPHRRELSEDDMWVLYAATEEMREEYGHVPEIRDFTYLWPEGQIMVSTRNPEDAKHVALHVVPVCYKGWPVVVTYSVVITSSLEETEPLSCTGPDWEINPNPERWEVHETLIAGIAISRYVESSSSGGGGGLPGEDPWMELLSETADGWSYGSLGLVTYDNVILSCAHVVAMDETGTFLDLGAPIYQPSGTDNRIGELKACIPIDFSPGAVNYADAAIVSIDAGVDVLQGWVFSEQGHYTINGWTTVSVNDYVRKSGPMTNVTWGTVVHTSSPFEAPQGNETMKLVDQIKVRLPNAYFAYKGDSGSAADKGGKFVGIVVGVGYELHWLFGYKTATLGYISKAAHIINGLGIMVTKPVGGGGGGDQPYELLGIDPIW